MPVPIFHVDAFTDRPFAGNPAAVCLLDRPRDEQWMQSVAREMNLSETAFLLPTGDRFSLRWFTPTLEVDLCGHATLASAHVLWETGRLPAEATASFETRSGLLEVRQREGWIVLDFPGIAGGSGPVPPAVVEALGARPQGVAVCGPRWLVELDDEDAVRALSPDFSRMRSVPGRAVIVTAVSTTPSEYDFVSRYFAPWVGVNEDPVTGVAHCCLGPYWGARLGKTRMRGRQVSARGGTVRVELQGERVLLGGKAVTVAFGELRTET